MMADIDIVPKRRTHVWLIVLLIAIVALIALFVMGRSAAGTTGMRDAPAASHHAAVPARVDAGA